MTPLLNVRLTVGHGPVVVARDITFEVSAGEVLAIIGPNGAGKTTLLSTIAGLLPAVSGEVKVASEPMRSGSARATSRAGVTLVPDHRALFSRLTTLENLRVADPSGGEGIAEILDLFPPLRVKAGVAAGKLSGGEQQMLALARALVQRPRVLLIDEMSMGLAPLIVESLIGTIRSYAAAAEAAVVLVEQHVAVALKASDYVLVMVHGDIVLEGSPEDLGAHPELQSVYLGGSLPQPPPEDTAS